jgi:hypothetical protein
MLRSADSIRTWSALDGPRANRAVTNTVWIGGMPTGIPSIVWAGGMKGPISNCTSGKASVPESAQATRSGTQASPPTRPRVPSAPAPPALNALRRETGFFRISGGALLSMFRLRDTGHLGAVSVTNASAGIIENWAW